MSTAASFNTIHDEVASLCREVAQLRLELTSSHKASLREHLLSFLDSYPVLDTNYKKELVELIIFAIFRTSGLIAGHKKVDFTKAIDPEQVNILTISGNGNNQHMVLTYQGEIVVRGEKETNRTVTTGLRTAIQQMVG